MWLTLTNKREREVCRLLFLELGLGLAILSLESWFTHSIPSLCAVCLETHSEENNICKNASIRRSSNIKQVHMVKKKYSIKLFSAHVQHLQFSKNSIIKHPFRCKGFFRGLQETWAIKKGLKVTMNRKQRQIFI